MCVLITSIRATAGSAVHATDRSEVAPFSPTFFKEWSREARPDAEKGGASE